MRTHHLFAAVSGVLTLMLATGASAQSATNSATSAAPDDTVTLSPFEVRAELDTGFVPSSALAGGRLALELKDTPVAYSVITRDFIDALNITDLEEAALWSPNVIPEVRPGGFGDDVSNSPGNYHVRGAGNGRRQRNFFLYFAPMDSYAIERFDFGRGPNAVLFGNGSLGGVSSSMTKQARFTRTFATLTFGAGSWDRYRSTLDVNRPVNDKLAVRVAAVWQDYGGFRDRQFNDNQAAFVTATYKFNRDTSLRIEGETGVAARNQTFSNIIDQFTGWDGVTTFSGRLDTLPANAAALGINRRASNYIVYDPFSGVNAIMRYQNDPITITDPRYVSSGNNPMMFHSINVPLSRFDKAIAGSKFRLPQGDEFTTAFDVHTIKQRYKDLQLTFDHRIGDVFIQAAADINRTTQSVFTPDVRNAGHVYIDINRLLPNGDQNPHFLEPYFDALLRKADDGRDAEGFRLAIGTTQDFGKWGNYAFNLMGGYTHSYDVKYGAYLLSIAQNPDHRRWGASGSGLGRTDGVWMRSYLSSSERPYDVPESVRWIDPIAGVDKTINPIWALESDRSDSFQDTDARYTYGIAAMTGKYFKNRLVVVGAMRADGFKNYTRVQQHGGEYSATDFDGRTGVFRPDAPADYASLSYTPKNAAGVITGPESSADIRPRDGNGNRQPQYANDRFKDDYNPPAVKETQYTPSVGAVLHITDWLSPYFNYAETFNPPAIIQRIDSSFLESTVAKGMDAGVRMNFLNGRINFNALYYTNSEINNPQDHGRQGGINAILNANPVGDNSPGGRNIRDVPPVPSIMRDIQDREAEGYEFELVANLTSNWRMTVNLGLPKVYASNSFQDLKSYLEENDGVIRQIVQDAGGLIDAAGVATVDTSIPANDRSPDVTTAVNNFNSLQALRATFTDARELRQRQPNANFYTDYTFRTGRLHGLRLGAGWQYRGQQIIGNRAGDKILDPNDPTKAIDDPAYDANSPALVPSWSNVVATVGYTWKLSDKLQLEFNLRVDNVLNETDPIWASGIVGRPPTEDFSSPVRRVTAYNYTVRAPRSFFLTTSLKF